MKRAQTIIENCLNISGKQKFFNYFINNFSTLLLSKFNVVGNLKIADFF